LVGSCFLRLCHEDSSVWAACGSGGAKGQPAFQAFGIALILLVWINYFSQVVMYAASWAHTTRAARAARPASADLVQGPQVPSLEPIVKGEGTSGRRWVAPFVGGAAAMLGLVALLRRRGPRRA
jgi:membrane protein